MGLPAILPAHKVILCRGGRWPIDKMERELLRAGAGDWCIGGCTEYLMLTSRLGTVFIPELMSGLKIHSMYTLRITAVVAVV